MLHYLPKEEAFTGFGGIPEGKPLPIQRWLSYDDAYKAPTYFARPAWSLALASAYPALTSWPLVIRLSSGKRVMIPLVSRRGRLVPFREFTGLPFGSYTLVLHEDGTLASETEITEAFFLASRSCSAISMNYWPLASFQGEARTRAAEHEASVIDVSQGSEQALDRMDGRALRNARAGTRRGITCAIDTSPGNADRYYDLLADAATKWPTGVPTISRALIRAVMETSGTDAEIWFAYHEERIVGGGLMLYGSQEAFYWSAATRPDAGNLRPNNTLNVILIEHSAARGMHWLNMGASEGLPGVSHFKKVLGATSVDYHSHYLVRPSYDLYHRVREFVPFKRREIER